jgi:hypothetical protein
MRLSLMKAAHDALDGAAYRKFGYLARFSRDVGGDRWSPLLNLEGSQSECSGIPHLAKNERDARISCTQPHPEDKGQHT